MIFGDEYSYNLYSRIVPLELANDFRPNFLYFKIFSFTSLCGDSFLECVRLFNILFYSLGCFFIYLVSRKFVPRKASILISFIAFLSPANTYVLFFMPEPTYFFFFWVYIYVLMTVSTNKSLMLKIFIPSLFLALLSLVKPHGFFLIFTLIVPFINHFKFNTVRNLLLFLIFIIVIFFCFYFFNRFFGFILTGNFTFNPFGQDYSGYASSIYSIEKFINRSFLTLFNLSGHILSLIFLFCIPIFLVIKNLKYLLNKKYQNLTISFIIGMTSLLFIISNFQASIIYAGIYESIHRLSMRHYDFLFPFFFIFSFIILNNLKETSKPSNIFSKFVFISIFFIIIFGFSSNFGGFTPWLADAPFFVALHNKYHFLIIFGVLILLSFTYLGINKKYALIFYLINFVGICIFTNTYIHNGVKGRIHTDTYDKAGIIINKIYPQITDDRFLIVGQDEASLIRSLFYLQSKSSSFKAFKLDSYLEYEQIRDFNWIALIGNYSFDNNFYEVIFEIKYNDNHDKITLIKLRERND